MKEIAYNVNENGCHVCTSHTMSKDYPLINRNGKYSHMSRFLWESVHGPIPKGLLILHSCDNKRCINIEHLHLGTTSDNAVEAIRHNLLSRVKLTRAKVEEIRSYPWQPGDDPKLAKKFNVSSCTVWKVRHGLTWNRI